MPYRILLTSCGYKQAGKTTLKKNLQHGLTSHLTINRDIGETNSQGLHLTDIRESFRHTILDDETQRMIGEMHRTLEQLDRALRTKLGYKQAGKTTPKKNLQHGKTSYLTINREVTEARSPGLHLTNVSEFFYHFFCDDERHTIGEIGGEITNAATGWLESYTGWSSEISQCLFVFNAEHSPSDYLVGLDEMLRVGLKDNKDKATVIINMATAENLKSTRIAELKAGCAHRGIMICPIVIPKSKVFRCQDDSDVSVVSMCQKDPRTIAKVTSFAHAMSRAACATKRIGEMTPVAAATVVRLYYAESINRQVFDPLFSFLHQRIMGQKP